MTNGSRILNARDHLTYIKYPSSPNVSFQYDSLNRLTNMVDAVGTTRYIYTAGNQLQREIAPFGFNTLLLTYTNRLRNVLRQQQPQLWWTNGYYYDAAARLTNITSQDGSFTYTVGAVSPGSRLVQKLLLPNTSYITNTFDNVARLTGTYLDNSANSVLDSAVYGYNRANQRTAFTNAAGTYVQYAYDNIGQLTVATSSAGSENRGYAYDAAWNLQYLTNNGIASTFTVDNKNELTSDPISGSTDSYDANGNLIYRAGFGENYGYDNENRLIGVTNGNYNNAGFAYDGLGRLRTRTEYTWNGSSWVVSTVTEYLYDGTRVIQERDINNNPTVSYTRGPDLSGTMEGAGGIGGLLARTSGYSLGAWSTNHFYHADGNGNITYLVDSNQAQAATYRYDAFGNTLSSSGSMAAANVYRFSSKEVHANSGMYIYLYRFYDPGMQRWINRDPLAEYQATSRRWTPQQPYPLYLYANEYDFVLNCPTEWIDPYGLHSFREWCSIVSEGAKGAMQGLAAAMDGIGGWIGYYPYERFYDPTDPTFQWSQALGSVGGDAFGLAVLGLIGDAGFPPNRPPLGPGLGRGPIGPPPPTWDRPFPDQPPPPPPGSGLGKWWRN